MKQITLAQVDKGIFERLRLIVVAAGYLPDRTQFTDEVAWQNALRAIKDGGKMPIIVNGVGPWRAREKQYNAIIIDRTQRRLSPLGYDGRQSFVWVNDHYEEHQNPDETAELAYSITAIGKTADDERVMQGLMYQAFGAAQRLTGYNADRTPTEGAFTLFREQIIQTNGEDFMETVYAYKTSALQIEATAVIQSHVLSIENIVLTTLPNGTN